MKTLLPVFSLLLAFAFPLPLPLSFYISLCPPLTGTHTHVIVYAGFLDVPAVQPHCFAIFAFFEAAHVSSPFFILLLAVWSAVLRPHLSFPFFF